MNMNKEIGTLFQKGIIFKFPSQLFLEQIMRMDVMLAKLVGKG